MKMVFEASGMRFYDDGTWIVPTSAGGIDGSGDWKVEDDVLHITTDGFVHKKGWAPANDACQAACRAYRERLARAVAATIVGSHGRNY